MRIAKYTAPKTLVIEEVEDFNIREDEIRIETIISGISHGTEMNVYRGAAPFFRRKCNGDIKLFEPAEEDERWTYPVRSCDPGVWYMGYANVGKVIEVGKEVEDIKAGDIVYSNAPHQSQIIKPAEQVIKLPDTLKPEDGIFFTNLMTVYNGILDSSIKLGDTVVVSGLGVLGQLLIQMVKMSGAFQVIGVDLYEKRLEAALANGADKVYNPKTYKDIAYEVRKDTNKKGADIVIEVTGNQKALNEAIRIAAPDTTVIALGWYQGQCTSLDLSEEFHHNRIKIRCSQTGGINPSIKHMWNNDRKEKTCLKLLEKLNLEYMLTHKIAYENIAQAYEMIDNVPQDIIQIALTY